MIVKKISEIKVLEQPRKDFAAVDMIADSIEKVGLLIPILVREVPSADKNKFEYVLVDGEQRLRAFKKLKRDEIPVTIIRTENDLEAKEAQMTANLMRSDLSYIERARGYAGLLLDAPAKYNAKVIANKFGIQPKQVEKMVALAGKLSPELDKFLCTGHYDDADLQELAGIPAEYQVAVIIEAEKNGHAIDLAIRKKTKAVLFSDVFTLEQARSSGKLHVKESWGDDQYRTFDMDFAHESQEAFEKSTQKKQDQELEKSKKRAEEDTAMTAVQKKAEREKKSADAKAVLLELKKVIDTHLKTKPTQKQIRFLMDEQVRKIQIDHLRILIKAYGADSKSKISDLNSDQLRKIVKDTIFRGVNTPDTFTAFATMLSLNAAYEDAKTWAKIIKKGL